MWDLAWTTELIDLLTVLTRLVALEPVQADLLARVVAGQVLTAGELLDAGFGGPQRRRTLSPAAPSPA